MVSERAVGFISGMLVALIALLAMSVIPRVMVNTILPEPEFKASDGTPMSSKPRVSTTSNAEAKARQDAAWDNPCPFLKTAWVQGLIEPDEMGYAPKNTIQELMDWAGVGRAVFPPEPYLAKFGTSGLPIAHMALNRPADSRIMHHEYSRRPPQGLRTAGPDEGIFIRTRLILYCRVRVFPVCCGERPAQTYAAPTRTSSTT